MIHNLRTYLLACFFVITGIFVSLEPVYADFEFTESSRSRVVQKETWYLGEDPFNQEVGTNEEMAAYSEDRVWVTGTDTEQNNAYDCLIDREGNIYCEIPFDVKFGEPTVSMFDGISLFNYSNNDTGYECYFFMDQDGNIINSLNSSEETIYKFLEYGDGAFLFLAQRRTMEEYADYLFAVDAYGNVIMPSKAIDEELTDMGWSTCNYLGEDVFWLTNFAYQSLFINLQTGAFVYSPIEYIYGPLCNDVTLVLYSDTVYLVRKSDLNSDSDGFIPYEQVTVDGFEQDLIDLHIFVDNRCFINDTNYCDIYELDGFNLKPLHYLDQYTELSGYGSDRIWCRLFDNHMILVIFRGVSDKFYLTLLDSDGNELYEPIEVDNSDCFFAFGDGYIMTSDKANNYVTYIYPDGSEHTRDVDSLVEMKDLNFGNIHCGMYVGELDSLHNIETDEPMTFPEKPVALHTYDSFDESETPFDFSEVTGDLNMDNESETPSNFSEVSGALNMDDDSDATSSQSNPVSAENSWAFNRSNYTSGGNTLFEADGVSVVFDGNNQLIVENRNPDNQTVYIQFLKFIYNGINSFQEEDYMRRSEVDKSSQYGYDAIKPDERVIFTCNLISTANRDSRYRDIIKRTGLSSEYQALPLETITFLYQIKFGFNGEWYSSMHTWFTDHYKDGDLDLFYQNKIYEIRDDRLAVDVYQLNCATGYSLLFKNVDETDITEWGGEYDSDMANKSIWELSYPAEWRLYNSDGTYSVLTENIWERTGDIYEHSLTTMLLFPFETRFVNLPSSDDSIRRDNALPKDAPLDIEYAIAFYKKDNPDITHTDIIRLQ